MFGDIFVDNYDQRTSFSQEEIPFNKLTFKEKLNIASEIATAAVPNIISSLGSLLKDAISLYFIGHLNNNLLFAALGFGLTWSNAFATAVIFGFAAGFGTLASQAYGAGNHYKLGLLYQKVLVVTSIVIFFISIFLWFTKAELVAMGFKEELSYHIQKFIRWLMVDFFFCMLFEVTRFYLVAQNAFYVPAYILTLTTTLHIFWCHLLINVMGLELVGMSIARTITDGTSAILILLYAKYRNPCPESWFPWTPECLQGLGTFTKDIASHGSSVYAEWIAFEISMIFLGFLGDELILAAHAATLNYIFLNYNVTFGFTLSTTVHVGNAAGEGSLHKAQKYAYIGLILNATLITCQNIFMFMMKNYIAYFYTAERDVRSYIAIMLTFYFFGMHGDLGCNTLAYLLRTLGQDRFVLKSYLFSYYGVGVSLSLITGVILGYGYYGIWGSLILGCWIMLGLNVMRFMGLDWPKEINKIYHEMKKTSELEMM